MPSSSSSPFARTAAIVLAAGKGTRMRAQAKNKVALPLSGVPMVRYTVDTLERLHLSQIIIVVGFASASVKRALGPSPTYVDQPRQLGTGHALKCGLRALNDGVETLFSLYGDDSAFYPPSLFRSLFKTHTQHRAKVSVLTLIRSDPTGLGRIIRDRTGRVVGIVEEKNASIDQKKIKEINTGLYCFDADWVKTALPKIKKNPLSQEYYLTDIIKIAHDQHQPAVALCWPDNSVWHGVNTPTELARAQTYIERRAATTGE